MIFIYHDQLDKAEGIDSPQDMKSNCLQTAKNIYETDVIKKFIFKFSFLEFGSPRLNEYFIENSASSLDSCMTKRHPRRGKSIYSDKMNLISILLPIISIFRNSTIKPETKSWLGTKHNPLK